MRRRHVYKPDSFGPTEAEQRASASKKENVLLVFGVIGILLGSLGITSLFITGNFLHAILATVAFFGTFAYVLVNHLNIDIKKPFKGIGV